MFDNVECNWTSVIILGLFLIFIVCISIWAMSKSKKIDCCKSLTNFKKCNAYFKNDIYMNYKQLCKNPKS